MPENPITAIFKEANIVPKIFDYVSSGKSPQGGLQLTMTLKIGKATDVSENAADAIVQKLQAQLFNSAHAIELESRQRIVTITTSLPVLIQEIADFAKAHGKRKPRAIKTERAKLRNAPRADWKPIGLRKGGKTTIIGYEDPKGKIHPTGRGLERIGNWLKGGGFESIKNRFRRKTPPR